MALLGTKRENVETIINWGAHQPRPSPKHEPFYLNSGKIMWFTQEQYDAINTEAHDILKIPVGTYLTPKELDTVAQVQDRLVCRKYGFSLKS